MTLGYKVDTKVNLFKETQLLAEDRARKQGEDAEGEGQGDVEASGEGEREGEGAHSRA